MFSLSSHAFIKHCKHNIAEASNKHSYLSQSSKTEADGGISAAGQRSHSGCCINCQIGKIGLLWSAPCFKFVCPPFEKKKPVTRQCEKRDLWFSHSTLIWEPRVYDVTDSVCICQQSPASLEDLISSGACHYDTLENLELVLKCFWFSIPILTQMRHFISCRKSSSTRVKDSVFLLSLSMSSQWGLVRTTVCRSGQLKMAVSYQCVTKTGIRTTPTKSVLSSDSDSKDSPL